MANGTLRRTTGQLDWSAGVNSNKAPTIAGPGNPNGLPPNGLAWANNATVRGNGISPRRGWVRRASMPVKARFQDAFMYEPDAALPHVIAQIGGRVYRVRVDTDYSIDDLSALSGLVHPADTARGYSSQAEQFLVIQAGDFVTLPLFYDGVNIRRSVGPAVSYGLTAADFVVPAVGGIADVTLTAPYTGPANATIIVNGKRYLVVNSQSVVTLKDFGSGPGSIYPAGTPIYPGSSNVGVQPVAVLRTSIVTPGPGGTLTNVPVTPDYTGTVPLTVNIFGVQWQIFAVGTAPPAANHVLLSNIDDTPGATVLAGAGLYSSAELPAAGPMDYYMGRMWLANGREYVAGDIVGGPSGTAQYNFRDSVLKMFENTYLSLGGTFRVPTNAGNIRALKHPANLDTALGEGQLLVFTRETIYSVNVVPTRAEWQSLSEPIQRVVQINHGSTSDWSVATVNGDLFYRSVNGINSFIQANRFFGQWGNRPISVEEERATAIEDKGLLGFASGIAFDNRLLETALPEDSDVGVIHKGILPLNFDLISTLSETLPPKWEGINEGLDILKLLNGDFGGRERAFAFVRSKETGNAIELWEFTATELEDSNSFGESRIVWAFETPSFTWDQPFALKQLDSMELWIDRLFGTVDFVVQFRPDQHPCWEYWFKWQICSPRNNCEDPSVLLPCDYPSQTYKQSYRATMVLPTPPSLCQVQNARPINIGYSFQFRVWVKGYCRVRGLLVHAFDRDKAPFEHLVCADAAPGNAEPAMRTI